MDLLLRILFLCLFITTAISERDENVCDAVTSSCGPLPPPLPQNFEMKSEHTDLVSKNIAWEEMYFDYNNLRGKIVFLRQGVEHHFIFDYNASQIIAYDVLHPGTSIKRDPLSEVCAAGKMENSHINYIFGYKGGNFETKHPRMYNSYEALRYGAQYQYKYNDTDDIEERGLKGNKFYGCIYDSAADITAGVTYTFSAPELVPSASIMEFIVDGIENGAILSVPLQCRYKGVYKYMDNNYEKQTVKFNARQSISWFRGEPVFDETKFQIPPLMYCKNYRGWKPLPKFPRAFSTGIQITAFSQDMDGKLQTANLVEYYKVWYDKSRRLVREDLTPLKEHDTDIISKFQNTGPVTIIRDFNLGVEHLINKASGRCFSKPIEKYDYFEAASDDLYVEIADPEEAFLMTTDEMEYKGQYYTRGILCDVWAGKYFNKRMNRTLFTETYISTDGWHEDVEEKRQYSFPVKHTVITNIDDDEFQQSIAEKQFFKFKSSPPPLAVFDIRGCMETLDHKFYALVIEIPPDEEEIAYKYKNLLQEAAQLYISEIAQVSTPLRIQSMKLQKAQGKNFLTFAILGKDKLKTNIPISEKGATLEAAEDFLLKFINNGSFMLKYKTPLSDEVQIAIAYPGNLFRIKEGKLSYADIQRLPASWQHYNVKAKEIWYNDDNISYQLAPKKGMSRGALAGLSIAMLLIGIAIGVLAMYYYLRQFSNRNIQDQYAMQNK